MKWRGSDKWDQSTKRKSSQHQDSADWNLLARQKQYFCLPCKMDLCAVSKYQSMCMCISPLFIFLYIKGFCLILMQVRAKSGILVKIVRNYKNNCFLHNSPYRNIFSSSCSLLELIWASHCSFGIYFTLSDIYKFTFQLFALVWIMLKLMKNKTRR